MLADHADAGGKRGTRIAGGQRQSVYQNLSTVGDIVAKQDIDQGALACTIFSQQRNDLATPQRERDVVVGHKTSEMLRDVSQLEQRGRPVTRGETGHSLRRWTLARSRRP